MNSEKKQQVPNKKKNIIIQWVFPTLIFIGAIVLMLYSYGVAQNRNIIKKADSSIATTAKRYSDVGYSVLMDISCASQPIARLLSKTDIKNSESLLPPLKALSEQPNVRLCAVVGKSGKGITNAGERIQLDLSRYDVVLSDRITYFLTEDDQISSNRSLAVVVPLEYNQGYLISYFHPESIRKSVSISDYDGKTCYTIVDAKGNVVFTTLSDIEDGSNLYHYFETTTQKEDFDKLRSRVSYGESFRLVSKIGDQEYYNCLVPFGEKENKWFFVMSVSNSYVETIKNSDWQPTKRMVINLILSMIIFGAMVTIINVVNKIRYNDRSKYLQQKADTDLLTELNNKIATERKIKEYIEEDPSAQAMMFIFDIDNFKKINDTRGHAFGDEVLREIGMRLRTEFRVSDIIGRVGGDEFVLFLKNIKDDGILKREAGRVASLFDDFKVGQYSKYKVTASIGCAVFPRDGETFETLYKAADNGLYKAKKRGKNQLAFYYEEESVQNKP